MKSRTRRRTSFRPAPYPSTGTRNTTGTPNSPSKRIITVGTLLGGVLFTHFGSYLVQPYLSVILSAHAGFSLRLTGIILASSSTAYIATSLLGGVLTDRLGLKWVGFAGLVLRGAGLFLYAGAGRQLALFYLAAILTGVGNGFYIPAAKAGIAKFSDENNRTFVFSLRGIAANIGTTLGPLLGAFIIERSTFVLFATAALLYQVMGILHAMLVPSRSGPPRSPKASFKASYLDSAAPGIARQVLQDHSYLLFTGLSILVWMLYTQLTFSIPLRMTAMHLPQSEIGWLWALSSLLIITTQAYLTKRVSGIPPLRLLAYGTCLLAVGFGSVSLSRGFGSLLASVLLITIGEMLVMPTIDSAVALFATEKNAGLYYGIASVAFGAGDALGNLIGGIVMNTVSAGTSPVFPWMVYGTSGLIIAFFLFGSQTNRRLQSRLSGGTS